MVAILKRRKKRTHIENISSQIGIEWEKNVVLWKAFKLDRKRKQSCCLSL